MFVGHFGISFALKRWAPKVSLGLLFLATQFVDLLWSVFVMIGLERVEIEPGYTEANALNFAYYPFSHSLAAALIWGGLVYAGFRYLGPKDERTAIVMGIAVASHWFLDLLTHAPDLPLLLDSGPKVGFGLWNYVAVVYIVEGLIFLTGFGIYVISFHPVEGPKAAWPMVTYVAVLMLLNLVNLMSTPPSNTAGLAFSGLVLYLVCGGVAHYLDARRKEPAIEDE